MVRSGEGAGLEEEEDEEEEGKRRAIACCNKVCSSSALASSSALCISSSATRCEKERVRGKGRLGFKDKIGKLIIAYLGGEDWGREVKKSRERGISYVLCILVIFKNGKERDRAFLELLQE